MGLRPMSANAESEVCPETPGGPRHPPRESRGGGGWQGGLGLPLALLFAGQEAPPPGESGRHWEGVREAASARPSLSLVSW